MSKRDPRSDPRPGDAVRVWTGTDPRTYTVRGRIGYDVLWVTGDGHEARADLSFWQHVTFRGVVLLAAGDAAGGEP